MKISVVGGGPGGLYFAILAKKEQPSWEIDVYERNRADDTFGFGCGLAPCISVNDEVSAKLTPKKVRKQFKKARK